MAIIMRDSTQALKKSIVNKSMPKAKTAAYKKSLWDRIVQHKYLYMLLLPIIVYFIIFKYLPMAGLNIAFKDFRLADGLFAGKWVGFKHFNRLFSSSDFYMILRNTLLLNVYGIIFSFPVPIILAIMLNEIRVLKFKKVIQSVLYVPHFISWVVLGGIVISLLSPSTGIINIALSKIGITPIFFLKSPFWWTVSYIVSGIWQSAGWGTIIYIAAITSIDPQIYESAMIDGAGKMRQIWHITLPGIRGTIAIMLILKMGHMLDVGFEQVYILQNDAVRSVSEVFSTFEYRIGLQGAQYSFTTALGLFKGVVGLILITTTNKVVKSLGSEGIW